MRKFILYFFISSLAVVFYSCQPLPNSPPPDNITSRESSSIKKSDLTFDNLKTLSKDLATLLKEDIFKNILFSSIQKSTYDEKILEASEFLNKKIIVNNKTSTIYDQLLSIDENNSFVKNLNRLDFGLIDIYFPSKIHRELWNKNVDLYVAPVSQKELEGKDSMVGYDTKGNSISLTTGTLPNTPVLVVTFSEKRGIYNTNSLNSQLSKINTVYNYNIYGIYVKKDYDDGWFLGDMEIYLKVKKKIGTNGTYGGWNEINLGQLAHNSAKYFYPAVNIAQSNVKDYYIKIEIWEDDGYGSGDDDFVADEYYNNYRNGSCETGDFGPWLGSTSEFYYGNFISYNGVSTYDGILGSSDYDTMCLTKTE